MVTRREHRLGMGRHELRVRRLRQRAAAIESTQVLARPEVVAQRRQPVVSAHQRAPGAAERGRR